jgi:hypothetical protein
MKAMTGQPGRFPFDNKQENVHIAFQALMDWDLGVHSQGVLILGTGMCHPKHIGSF